MKKYNFRKGDVFMLRIRNKKLQALVLAGLLSVTSFGLGGINSNATNTLAYKEVDGVQSINVVELAKLRGETLMEISHPLFGDGVQININGKLLQIYDESPYIFIDGRTVPLKTEPVVDSITGEAFDYPLPQIAQKEGEGYLIPMSVIEEKINIKGDKDGIVIETPKEEETEKPKEEDKTENSTNSGSTTNSGSSSNSGSSNTGSSNNGSSNSGSSSNTGGSTNSGSTNTGGSSNSGSSNSGSSNNGSSNNSGSTNNGSSSNSGGSTNNGGSSNNGSSNSGGSSSNGGSTQTPTPTPEPTPTPTPEPSKPAVTGISFSDLKGRLAGMGFDSKGNFMDDGIYVAKARVVDTQASFLLEHNTPRLANAIKNCFNLLLPTQGSRLWSIITSPCSSQTLQMDGRTVVIQVFDDAVSVDIK